MSAARMMLWGAMLTMMGAAWGQAANRQPYAGYVYPAGGRQGTVVQVNVGGQNLRGVKDAYVSGSGVTAKVVQYIRALNKKELGEVARHLRFLIPQRTAEALGRPVPPWILKREKDLPPLPDHPWINGLDKMTLTQLDELRQRLFDPKKEPNPQLAENVTVDLTIDAGAAPGCRELRLATPRGLTNPVRFEIGTLPEVLEQEPNGLQDPGPAIALPAVLNGQIMPGDTDVFHLQAKRGQKLVMAAQARNLIPYLADAVPGWFQAVLTLYDDRDQEVAFDDDYRFDPDPVIFYTVPRDGVYRLAIRDAIYRGREDFVYRITVGQLPFVTQIFPLGGRLGSKATASVVGYNLPRDQVQLDTAAGAGVRPVVWPWAQATASRYSYAVDSLPETNEVEPNNTAAKAQTVTLPRVINGRISQPGDVDYFRFEGRAGQRVIADVQARCLGSPLDSLVRLIDASGHVIAWNDDHEDPAFGLVTDFADSYVSATLPRNGAYLVRVSDVLHHGGEEYAYRLRLSAPEPDFALRLSPSSLSVPAGHVVPVTVDAIRQDGFEGAIDLTVADAASGFKLSGAQIPAGCDHMQMTITAPPRPLAQPVSLHLEGSAVIGGATVRHAVVPAEHMMQAFVYWQLVPSQNLMVQVTGVGRYLPVLQVADNTPIRIPAGGQVQVMVKVPRTRWLQNPQVELSNPPAGLTMKTATPAPGGLEVTLLADAKTLKAGYQDNLIMDAYTEMERKRPNAKGAVRKFRVSLGYLPAVAFEIVKP